MDLNAEMTPERETLMMKHSTVWMALYDMGMRNEKLMRAVQDCLNRAGYNSTQDGYDLTVEKISGVLLGFDEYELY